MQVEITFKDKTETETGIQYNTRVQYHVKETWVDGALYCMRTAYMVVQKYPIENIYRIKEIEDPTPPGQSPDFFRIKKDFGYVRLC